MVNQVAWSSSLRSGALAASVSVSDAQVELRVEYRDRVAIENVALGIQVRGADLGTGSRFLRSVERDVVEEWTAHSGKARGKHTLHHRELAIELRHPVTGLDWTVLVRVSSDGVAVRYAIPALQGLSRLTGDGTRVELTGFDRAWVLDYQTWYETPRVGVDIADLPDGDYGFPFLARAGDDYLLVTESGIDGRFSGAHPRVAGSSLSFDLADASVEIARGEVTPWRVFIMGSLADVVESLFVDELAPVARPELAEVDWVRPGRAAWSWWSDFYSGAQLEHQKRFVDAAAELSWEHLLIDCGWEDTWVPEIVAYAGRRGIQVHLWVVWHDLDGPDKLGKLALWRSWGVAGIKVDFMESEAKDRYRWYDTVLQETARLGLMVNFHGSVIPRGWSRTWPQVIGYEAIRGSEYYVFYNDTPLTAEHNVIQPFTRNAVGAMDYTPVAFSAPGRVTSDGHELALSVAFECGITHFADDVNTYLERPLVARFLAELAPAWDETLLLGGSPDTEAVIARRAGDRWFIGCIAAGEARTVSVDLERLQLAASNAWVVTDASGGRDLTDFSVTGGASLEIPIAANGGFVAIVSEQDLFRAGPRAVRSAPAVSPVLAEIDAERDAELVTSPGATVRVPPGWTAASIADDRWRVRAPRDLASGGMGVVTVEHGDGVPVVSHARLVSPLVPGIHTVSLLPLLAFRNESGPVERDQSNGGGNPNDGSPMRMAGEAFDDGLGVSTPSSVDLYLGARADGFVASVGVDDESPATRAIVVVSGDGRELATRLVEAGQPPVQLAVDVTGVGILTLSTREVATGDTPAHVDWASARLIVTSTRGDNVTPPSAGHR